MNGEQIAEGGLGERENRKIQRSEGEVLDSERFREVRPIAAAWRFLCQNNFVSIRVICRRCWCSIGAASPAERDALPFHSYFPVLLITSCSRRAILAKAI